MLRYADKKTLDDHMASPPVVEMISFMTSSPIVEGTPKIRNLSWIDDMVFTKPEVREQKDPFIVFAELEFTSGARDGTLKHWKGNLDSSKKESGCFVYGFLKDPEQPDHMYTMEVYESEDFLWNTHVKAPAVQETIAKTEDARKNLILSKLKMVDGFLYRS
jgi:quinol monooxygenase YgiN